jgi:plasmid stability protein
MPSVHIRNVDDAVIESLKRRAAENRRSLEGELRVLLEQAAFPSNDRTGWEGRRPKLQLKTVAVGSKSNYGRDEIYADEED